MMAWAAHGAPRPIGLATWCVVCSVAPSRRIIASANRAHEQSVVQRCTVVHVCMVCRPGCRRLPVLHVCR
jgi:hypothetical protein